MRTWIVTLFVLLGITGCSEKKKQRDMIEQQIVAWSGRQIQFPPAMTFTRYALDTVAFDVQASEYKLLVYTDSTGCTSCKLQLPKWKEMIALTDSVAPGKVSYLFIFDNSDLREIRFLLKQSGLDIPVCIDSDSRLNKLNHFPENSHFQTFLLDKDNRVVAIGNPASNPAVRDLYISRITGGSQSSPSPQTTVAVKSTIADLGRFTLEEQKIVTFTITNSGEQPLVLIEANSSCGCTEATFSKEPILSGKSIPITITFTPKETGAFSKTVVLHANIKQPVSFTLRGEVVSN